MAIARGRRRRVLLLSYLGMGEGFEDVVVTLWGCPEPLHSPRSPPSPIPFFLMYLCTLWPCLCHLNPSFPTHSLSFPSSLSLLTCSSPSLSLGVCVYVILCKLV